jgi:hypothetical protein
VIPFITACIGFAAGVIFGNLYPTSPLTAILSGILWITIIVVAIPVHRRLKRSGR